MDGNVKLTKYHIKMNSYETTGQPHLAKQSLEHTV
jgi:hypothetical protein